MRIAIAKLVSASPYSPSKPVEEKKSRDETHDDFDQRTWKFRCHFDQPTGMVFIPGTCFKNCISEAAKYKSIQIPGKGKSTYTKHFEAGILCHDPVNLGVHIDNVQPNRIFVPASGKRGDGKRVWKTFPIFQSWSGEAKFYILDDIIDNEVFRQHLVDAGQFIGVGSFRPRNNGWFGRFNVESVTWS